MLSTQPLNGSIVTKQPKKKNLKRSRSNLNLLSCQFFKTYLEVHQVVCQEVCQEACLEISEEQEVPVAANQPLTKDLRSKKSIKLTRVRF
mmetsp:Transcript_96555/g.272954  ORF Transcript_96555/g.272954 Transcript_96555/m.272954 type:complete len:90 (+) Transcript_96555:1764-2033(+)